jgi:hypothetical protein
MDLIDRYVIAVRRHLPRPLEKDIVQELSDNLRSEAEDREQQLGRPLSSDDQSELLKKHGHPWLMASRYLPQQQLIGPGLYPYYRQALVLVVFWVVLPIVLIGGVLAAIYAEDWTRVWSHAIGAAWTGSIYSVGIVTIVFAILERQHVRFTALDKWDPSWLPEPSGARAVPRSESLVGLIVSATMLLWWIDLLRVPAFSAGDYGEVRFVAAPIWSTLYLPIVISLALTVATTLVDLLRPWRTTFFSVVRIAIDIGNAVLAIAALRAGRWVEISGNAEAPKLIQADYWVNNIVQWSLIVVIIICVTDVLLEVWQVTKARRELPA